jgi:isopentenyl phosphate kinase
MNELVLLKLGGSVITDKESPFTARKEVISRLGREISSVLQERKDLRLVVGHGSGSFGHLVAHQYKTHLGDIHEDSWHGLAETARAAAKLNRIVVDALADAGVPALSIQPSASAICDNGRLISLDIHLLDRALAAGLVPVVYGDVALDHHLGFTIISTEKIFGYLCAKMEVGRIILTGKVDGVFDRDPLRSSVARRYAEITPGHWASMCKQVGGSHATDVTGGMTSKVEGMLQLVQRHPDVSVSIISGEVPENTARCLAGLTLAGGTVIHDDAQTSRSSVSKH